MTLQTSPALVSALLPTLLPALLLAACSNAETAAPEPETDLVAISVPETDLKAETDTPAPQAANQVDPLDPDVPLDIQPLPLEKILSPAEKAFAAHKELYDLDSRLHPIVDLCGEPQGAYYPDYLFVTFGYQDQDTAAYKGTIFTQLASHSQGDIATETLFIPKETLIFEVHSETEVRMSSTEENISGVTGGFRRNGEREPSYDFEGVGVDRIIHCNKPQSAVERYEYFLSEEAARPPVSERPEIRYSVDIRSEVNLEGMCEYMHEEALATISDTLERRNLIPIQQIAEAPNNDMRIRLTPLPNEDLNASNDCRYDVDIVRNWTDEPWFATPARNQNYESGYELIFQSLFDIGEDFKKQIEE